MIKAQTKSKLNGLIVQVRRLAPSDYVHHQANKYTTLPLKTGTYPPAPVTTCWFYLGIGTAVSGVNDRYLHPGRVSAGCITMGKSEWTTVDKARITCRRGNNVDVGTVTVR